MTAKRGRAAARGRSRARKPVIGIAGLGLIGGALALDLRRAGYEIVGLDRPARRRRALALGYVSRTRASVAALVGEAEVVVLAAPPRANLRLLREAALAVGSGPGAPVVTDVGSVKRGIVHLAEQLELETFVGGHPMAGRERSGLAAAQAGLFAGRPWLVVPTRISRPGALRDVEALARAVGARPARMDAARHDRAVAFLSHLPQIVAWALLEAVRQDSVAWAARELAGPGFRDMTRLAGSPRALWGEILAENAGEVRRALRALRQALAG